jgi:hypothetical protein
MTHIEALVIGDLTIEPNVQEISFSGVISVRNPEETITPYLRRLHDAAVASRASELVVDLTALRFMNSSSVRALVDWVEWIRKEPDDKRYVLHFRSSPNVTWQSTTLQVIEAFGDGSVRISKAAAA